MCRKVIESRKPTVIYDGPSTQWKALSWDLWNMSARWPLLSNVLVTEKESFMILKQVIFLLKCYPLCASCN